MAHPDHLRPTDCPLGGKRGILDLPLEIFEQVATLVDPYDLLAMWLLNRELEGKVLRTFTRTHFTVRSFLLCSRASLEALAGIAAHPTFGKALRTLELCPDRIYHTDQEATPLGWELYRDQALLKETGEAFQIVSNAFAKLRVHNVAIEVNVVDANSTTEQSEEPFWKREPMGLAVIKKEVAPWVSAFIACNEYAVSIIEAIVASRLLVDRFKTDVKYGTLHLPSLTSDHCLKSTRHLFSTLKSLDLQFTDRLDINDSDFTRIAGVFKDAQSLETLSLSMPDYSGPPGIDRKRERRFYPMLPEAILSLTFPKLKFMFMSHFLIDLVDVENFMIRHIKTLDDVALLFAELVLGDYPSVLHDRLANEAAPLSDYSFYTDRQVRKLLYQRIGFEGCLEVYHSKVWKA